MDKKGVVKGIIEVFSFTTWIVILLVFALIFKTATACGFTKAAQEVLGEDIRGISLNYQLQSYVRSPVTMNGVDMILAEVIALAVHKDSSDDYALLRQLTAERLVPLAGAGCFQVRISERGAGGALSFKRQYGFCGFTPNRETVVYPYAGKTFQVDLQSGPGLRQFSLCYTGQSVTTATNLYCKQTFGGFTCGDISRGNDKTWKVYDSQRLCDKNLRRAQAGKI